MIEKKNNLFHGKKEMNGYVLHVDNVSKGRFREEINFELYLKTVDGEISINPVVSGKYFSGRGKFYKPWLDIYYDNLIKFKSSKIVDLSKRGLDKKLFKHLSRLLPPGGHIMVAYPNHGETKIGLEHGIPAPATPLGYLLWKSECTWFKDWYFAEGFWEGDQKLQGNKSLDSETRKKNLWKTRKELTEFLEREKKKDQLFLDARERALDVLQDIVRETSTG